MSILKLNFLKKGSAAYEIKILDELKIVDIDLLNIDTQGYEMEVLKGSRKLLSQNVKYIILEVNKKELYEGCPLVKDIDIFKKYGFIRTIPIIGWTLILGVMHFILKKT